MPVLSEESLKRLQNYRWPGNLRELRNVLGSALAVESGPGARDWRAAARQRPARRQLQPDRAARIGRHGRGLAGAPSAAGPAGGREDRSRGGASAAARTATRCRQRFAREAQATAELQSPHTVQLYDFGITERAASTT